mmetsp:Transcript_106919/g.345041  ORF Transcript_106919/g.345041 Transcript_106919/m.345041 type:complete len:275 (+) Transcript_106919:1619-2443(+)
MHRPRERQLGIALRGRSRAPSGRVCAAEACRIPAAGQANQACDGCRVRLALPPQPQARRRARGHKAVEHRRGDAQLRAPREVSRLRSVSCADEAGKALGWDQAVDGPGVLPDHVQPAARSDVQRRRLFLRLADVLCDDGPLPEGRGASQIKRGCGPDQLVGVVLATGHAAGGGVSHVVHVVLAVRSPGPSGHGRPRGRVVGLAAVGCSRLGRVWPARGHAALGWLEVLGRRPNAHPAAHGGQPSSNSDSAGPGRTEEHGGRGAGGAPGRRRRTE